MAASGSESTPVLSPAAPDRVTGVSVLSEASLAGLVMFTQTMGPMGASPAKKWAETASHSVKLAQSVE